MRRWTALVAVTVAIVIGVPGFSLLVKGRQVLIRESRVEPGEDHADAAPWQMRRDPHPRLSCLYFNGWSTSTLLFRYSPDGIAGHESCPFILRN